MVSYWYSIVCKREEGFVAAAAAGDFFVAATRGYALSIVAIAEAIDQSVDQLLVASILTDVEEQQDSDCRGQLQKFENERFHDLVRCARMLLALGYKWCQEETLPDDSTIHDFRVKC